MASKWKAAIHDSAWQLHPHLKDSPGRLSSQVSLLNVCWSLYNYIN